MGKVKAGVISFFLLFLVACGANISDEELYDEAISILESDFAEPNAFTLEYSSLEMTEIEELDDNLYEVSGNVFDQYQNGASFTVKISIDGDVMDYEWMVE
ncbi:hypothetical protein KFZ58_15945 [Virgibacillus sp. NKC19-16]|uniref:hypothetical protein n=1 Tax=Virgibacillus salidurans TaxID=2831673 RepID=UPI001F368E22|nr:hypothetical protein [Virgibacillus sp. NKC19-16]UJL45854.1 hypothetical protein KFZ58_15945 [Virgibacillus sp. NKC19-16]